VKPRVASYFGSAPTDQVVAMFADERRQEDIWHVEILWRLKKGGRERVTGAMERHSACRSERTRTSERSCRFDPLVPRDQDVGTLDTVAAVETSQAIPVARAHARVAWREGRQLHDDLRMLERFKFRRGFDESLKRKRNPEALLLVVVAFSHGNK
jgi:hypothetical protein